MVATLFVVGEAAQAYLANASGSEYLGIAIAGGLVALLAPLERLVGRMVR